MNKESRHKKFFDELAARYKADVGKDPTQERRLQDSYHVTKYEYMGKQGLLWCIEVQATMLNNSTKVHRLHNQTGAEIRKFREDIFFIGIMLPNGPGEWVVIPPMGITEIKITQQSKYFE